MAVASTAVEDGGSDEGESHDERSCSSLARRCLRSSSSSSSSETDFVEVSIFKVTDLDDLMSSASICRGSSSWSTTAFVCVEEELQSRSASMRRRSFLISSSSFCAAGSRVESLRLSTSAQYNGWPSKGEADSIVRESSETFEAVECQKY